MIPWPQRIAKDAPATEHTYLIWVCRKCEDQNVEMDEYEVLLRCWRCGGAYEGQGVRLQP